MEEEIKLVVVLAPSLSQGSRHIAKTCELKAEVLTDWQAAERDHVWTGAVKKDLLLTLYVISIAQVREVL